LSRNQRVNAPVVDMPPSMLYRPGSANAVAHIRGSGTGSPVTWMKNIVVPYMTIMSPGSTTPTLTASAAASIVPAVTGVPAFSPVSAAAVEVTSPAT
jgi:hypothetical protein